MTKLKYIYPGDVNTMAEEALFKDQPIYETDTLEMLVKAWNKKGKLDLSNVWFMILSEENCIPNVGPHRHSGSRRDENGNLFVTICGELNTLGMGVALAHELTLIGLYQSGDLLRTNKASDTWLWRGVIYENAYKDIGINGHNYIMGTAHLPWETEAVLEHTSFMEYLRTQL